MQQRTTQNVGKKSGIITPDTFVENETGGKARAKTIRGLFPEPTEPSVGYGIAAPPPSVPPVVPPPIFAASSPSATPSPFAAPPVNCPHCGKPETAGAAFCGSCGKSMIPPSNNISQPYGSMPNSPFASGASGAGLGDLGFTRFITPTGAKVIWVICLVICFLSFCLNVGFVIGVAKGITDAKDAIPSGWKRIPFGPPSGQPVKKSSGDIPDEAVSIILHGTIYSAVFHVSLLLFIRMGLERTLTLSRIEEHIRATRMQR